VVLTRSAWPFNVRDDDVAANRIISIGKYGTLGVEIKGNVGRTVEGVIRVRVGMVAVGRVKEVANKVVRVHEIVGSVAPMFGGQTADGVVGVRGDAIVSVCFLNKTAKGIIGVVPRRVFLVRFGQDEAAVVVGVRRRVADGVGEGREAVEGVVCVGRHHGRIVC